MCIFGDLANSEHIIRLRLRQSCSMVNNGKKGEKQTSTGVNCDEGWLGKERVTRRTGAECAEAEKWGGKERELYPPPLLVVQTEK